MALPLIGFVIALAASTSPDANSSPLAPALAGRVQCYEPNEEEKTCRSIAIYKPLGNGIYANTAMVLLSQSQPIVLETTTSVRVKYGAVCGVITSADVAKGKIHYSGQLLPDDRAAPILAKIGVAMAANMDREICTDYVQQGDYLIAKGRIEGGNPFPEQRVKWIGPTEGYIVAPSVAENKSKQ